MTRTGSPCASAATTAKRRPRTAVSATREKDLWNRYQATRTLADRNALVDHYWPWAQWIAKRVHAAHGAPSEWTVGDLAGFAAVGLIQSIERFDPTAGVRFITYSAWRIRGSIVDGMRDAAWQPRSVLTAGDEYRTMRQFPAADHNGPDACRPNAITDRREPAAGDRQDARDFWRIVCRGLNKAERLALLLYYRDGLPMIQVAAALSVSESMISQRLTALRKRIGQRLTLEAMQ